MTPAENLIGIWLIAAVVLVTAWCWAAGWLKR